jgi:hypothetical protein
MAVGMGCCNWFDFSRMASTERNVCVPPFSTRSSEVGRTIAAPPHAAMSRYAFGSVVRDCDGHLIGRIHGDRSLSPLQILCRVVGHDDNSFCSNLKDKQTDQGKGPTEGFLHLQTVLVTN